MNRLNPDFDDRDSLTHRCFGDNHLVSLSVWAMLTLAPISSHAQGSATNAEPPTLAATSPAATSFAKAILTTDQQKKLVALMTTKGHDVPLNPAATAALGLSKGDEVLTLRQLTVNEHPTLHTYIPLSDGGVLLIFKDTVVALCYRLDSNLKLVTAVSKKHDQAPVTIPVSDAEGNIRVELAYWAALADRH